MTFDPALVSTVSLGAVAGMTHALEADHIAAVASLATRGRTLGDTLRVGVAWGAGHALTLAVVAGALMAVGAAMPARAHAALELAVGAMLVVLGADVLRRLVAERVHFHQHRHGEHVHVHAHSHRGEPATHDRSRHEHAHAARVPMRAVLVGMTHGLAGSAALVAVAAGGAASPLHGIAYVLLFGVGSVAGMAALCVAIALPLRRIARVMTWTRNALHAVVGIATLAIGALVIVETAAAVAA